MSGARSTTYIEGKNVAPIGSRVRCIYPGNRLNHTGVVMAHSYGDAVIKWDNDGTHSHYYHHWLEPGNPTQEEILNEYEI